MDKGHKATDKELERIEKKLREIYEQAEKELAEKTDKYFERFRVLDAQKRLLVDAGKLSEEDYKAWLQAKIATGEHWKEMQRQIAERLTQADRDAVAYVNGELPKIYALNYNSMAESIQRSLRDSVSFELVDAHTVRNLAMSDKTLLPYKVVDGKKAERWHTQRVNSAVMQGVLQGESIPKIAKRLKDTVDMTAKGSAVRNARTAVTSAENKGRMDMLHDARDKGVIMNKVWLAAHDSRTREAHMELDGVEEEVDTPFVNSFGEIMYPGDTDADPANVYNCFVGETNIASDSEIIRSYKHKYYGKLVTIKTSGGVNFTCTPNHPILTVSGWVKAESLQKGDNLVVTLRNNNVSLGVNPNVNHCFPRIAAIHKLLHMAGGKRTVCMSVNFHGDIPASNVEIVTKKRLLRDGRNSGSFNSINKFLLKHSDKSFLRLRSFSKHFGRIWSSALGFVGGVSKSLSFFFAGLRHPEIHRFRPIALLYSGRVKPLDNDVARNAKLISKCLDGFSGFVFADNIVSVDFSSGCSHVYNLQTENGYYFVNSSIAQVKRKSNGIFAIAHNCRCTLGYHIVGFKNPQTGEVKKIGFYDS